jgi:tRNA pseudouridine(55) synthase
MEKNSGFHLLWKKLGETPNELILRWKEENPEYKNIPATYAGRLDPMAEGVTIILSGEKVHEKEKYLNLEKEYEFQVLWGVFTDTGDVLGKVSGLDSMVPEQAEIEKHLRVGVFEQKYPAYSSKPVDGKPLWQWAREGKLNNIKIPTHEVKINSAFFMKREKIKGEELISEITSRINNVKGDFRQKEILKTWKETLKDEETYIVDKIRINVSSGFYVRQFVMDLADLLKTKATTFHIKRLRIGSFAI